MDGRLGRRCSRGRLEALSRSMKGLKDLGRHKAAKATPIQISLIMAYLQGAYGYDVTIVMIWWLRRA